MSFGSNIKAARLYNGKTQVDLAKVAGVTRNAVSQWENGSTSPGLIKIALIASSLGFSVDELTSTGFNPEQNSATALTHMDRELVTIQQCNDVSGSMGEGVMLRDQPGNITSWDVTPEWLNNNIPQNTGVKNLRIVTGFGDSMRGMFNSGDPLIVDTGITSVEYDAVYFFRVGNEGFIKRLQRVPGRGLVALSENKAYESWAIADTMDFEVFARVLKVWKSEEF